MLTIEHLTHQLKSLRLNHTAAQAESLLSMAEENELSYLQFADSLVKHELEARNKKKL